MTRKYADQSTDSINSLVTGGTGFLGRWLLAELTRRGRRVLVPIRNASSREAELRSFVDRLGGESSRLAIVEGDLDQDELGLDHEGRARLTEVRTVFHLGARFAWGLDPALAHATNVEGTRRIVALAAGLPRLDRLVLVGGYRIGPRLDASGRLHRPDADAVARAGAYEASKHEAHRVALVYAHELRVPVTSVHPSGVIGDSRSGETIQTVGLGETFVDLANGRMPARVGSRRTFVPLVTVDFVATVLAEVAEDPAAVGLELPLFDERTPRLDALVDRVAAIAGVRPPWLRLPVGLVRALPERWTGTSREALEFLDDASYPMEATRTFLASRGLEHPDFDAGFERWIRYLIGAAATSAATERRSTLPLASDGSSVSRT